MRAEYRALKQRHGVVHLAGVCLGALVALEVARLENHQDKLALYAPPLFLDGWSLPRLTWLRPLGILPGMARRMRIPEAEPFGIKNPRIRKLIQQRLSVASVFTTLCAAGLHPRSGQAAPATAAAPGADHLPDADCACRRRRHHQPALGTPSAKTSGRAGGLHAAVRQLSHDSGG
jgi:hypothetical protein